jgi:hypothetical protein
MRKTNDPASNSEAARVTTEGEKKTGKVGESARRLSLESIYHPMHCNSETTPPWEPIAAALTRRPKWDPRTARRLVRRTVVGEQWVTSPGSREAEGEGGEGFYIAQSGRRPDLLAVWGGGRRTRNTSTRYCPSRSGG